GLAMGGVFPWESVPAYFLAQLLGAMSGTCLVWLTYKDHYKATQDSGLVSATFYTIPAIRNFSTNLLAELIGTFVLIFVIFHFTDGYVTSEDTPIGLGSIGAIPVAFLVWVIGLSLGGVTGYAINPARDLGPRIVHALLPLRNKAHFNGSYAWVPVIGPLLGALLAAFLYLCIY